MMLPLVSSMQKGMQIVPNPFKMPEDNNILLMRSAEEAQRKQEFQKELQLSVIKKNTFKGRMIARQLEMRKKLREDLEEEEESAAKHTHTTAQLHQDASACKLIMIKDRNIQKESKHEFINSKREKFYLEHAESVRKEAIKQLQEKLNNETKRVATAEKQLEQDRALFDLFLKESDKKAREAIKLAEQVTKEKLEKVAKIKRTTAQMMAIKSDISKYEETLQEYELCKDFLFKLAPLEWQEKQREKNRWSPKPTSAMGKREGEVKSRETDTGIKTPQPDRRREKRSSVGTQELPPIHEARGPSRHSVKSTPQSGKISPASEMDSLENEEEPELYFTEPQQVLDLMNELKEQNLSLFQNLQDIEEDMVEFRKKMEKTQKNIESEAKELKQQIDVLTETIQREKNRASEIKIKAMLYRYGNYEEEEHTILNALTQKTEKVYHSFIGDTEAKLSALQMLTAIEVQLGDLLDDMEMIPADLIATAQRAREKDRRIRLQEEKLHLQKQQHEERIKKAMARALAEIKRTSGRKLNPRSQPPVRKIKNIQLDNTADKDQQEYMYFFT